MMKKIWDISRIEDRESSRMELTDLVRFKGAWYCGFHEGETHHNHPSGRGRIIRSMDGEHWESVALFEWDGGDVREPKLSITAEGWLMVNTSIYFVSREPRMENGATDSFTPTEVKARGDRPNRYYQLDLPGTPDSDLEQKVARQSVTWLSRDGLEWSSAYTCESTINTWLWEVTWHGGMGYSTGYNSQKIKNGNLFRTRDGKHWRILAERFFPEGSGNEHTIAFDRDGTAYSLLRDASKGKYPMMGIGTAPCYTEWEWKPLAFDLADGQGPQPAEAIMLAPFSGPKLIRLSDGRFVAAARVLLSDETDGRVALFFLNPATATLTKFALLDGTSYPGIVEHEGKLWVTCCGESGATSIALARIPIPMGDECFPKGVSLTEIDCGRRYRQR